MEVSKKIALLLMSLLCTTCISATRHDQSDKIPQSIKVLHQEEEGLYDIACAVVKMTADFEEKYGYKPRILCATCKKDSRTVESVLCQIFLDQIDCCSDKNRVSAARKLLAEAVEIFPYKELDVLLEFMARAANELQMPCDYQCLETHWEIIHAD